MSTPAARLASPGRTAELGDRIARAIPGLALALGVAAAATLLASQLKLGAMVFALLIGMALNMVASDARYRAGLDIASRAVLRIGVALLGLRITLGEVTSLGWGAIAMAAAGIVLTIAFGIFLARRLGLGDSFGVLSGGAVAICGVSAAMAINSVLPKHGDSDRDSTFVAITVTTLSTVAMVSYPVLTTLVGFDDRAAGVFFGATIHDVAQVVGAGYSVSEEAGDMATVMKLLRVAMLLPVCIVIGMVLQARGKSASRADAPILPWFVAAFAVLVLVSTAGWAPATAIQAGSTASQWFLVIAMAAIGMKTSLPALLKVGPRAILLVVVETLFLGGLVLAIGIFLGKSAGF